MTQNSTITITWGEQIETHHTMQKIGKIANKGFSLTDLQNFQLNFNPDTAKIYDLTNLLLDANVDAEKAYLLVVKNGVQQLLSKNDDKNKDIYNDLKKELYGMPFDNKKFMYGASKESKARHCICIADFDQQINHEGTVKKGTVVNFTHLPILSKLRATLNAGFAFNEKYLLAEGNHYYDVDNCGIGYHGDTERRYVIGMRFGSDMPLHYQWQLRGENIGKHFEINLDDGDIYVMSDKTTGYDWRKKNIFTLKHAAGSDKYTKY